MIDFVLLGARRWVISGELGRLVSGLEYTSEVQLSSLSRSDDVYALLLELWEKLHQRVF